MTRLCVAIFVQSVEQAKRDVARAAEAGADIVELRIDHLTDAAAVERVVAECILPCVVTCRPTWEGGHSELADAERVELLTLAHARSTNFIDVELAAVRRDRAALTFIPEQSIVSSHDFAGRPDRLYALLTEMNDLPSRVNKLVWTARTVRDNLEAFEILQQRQKPTIALCMGEAGLISRVLAKKFGAFLTFASLDEGSGTAPGQVSIHDMKRLYRWDALNPRTKVYGVVASPVAHSMSPAVHNAAFDEANFDGVYLPLLVNPGYESFKAFMESFLHFEGLDLSGLSVTLPHKENALRYLKEKGAAVEPLAERIGAVNTIVIDRAATQHSALDTQHSPALRGLNTDYAAILDSITAKLGITRGDLASYRVAVIGAGGTGRTAVAALAHCGATVVVYNRTRDRADALAAEFNGKSGKVVAAPIEKLCDSCCQVYVNTTSVGMHPDVDASPFGDAPPEVGPDTLVFDAIYNPPVTKFLRQAQEAGARTIGGIEMFVRQAAAQFEAWTGLPAPADTMRRVVERRLAR
jgi:3-dehydroquinate dehydratase/shikimate dehydrogenase